MKQLFSLSIALVLVVLACATPASAQVRRPRTGSSGIAVPLPIPDDVPEGETKASADEGKVFTCGDDIKEATSEDAPTEATDKEQVFTVAEVTTRAVITTKPTPRYTEEARWNGTGGRVRLRLLLASTGRVTTVSVVKGLPDGLTQTAVAAACRVRFTPALKDGRQVSQYATLEYGFHLDDRPLFLPRRRPTFYSRPANIVSDNIVSDDSATPFYFPTCLVRGFLFR